jgi:transposase
MPKNRCVPDVAEQRELWKQAAEKFDPDQLVFLDESGVNTDLTRTYGRSIGKQRVVDRVPLATPKRRSIVGAIRLDGTIRYRSWQGSINGKRFLEYLKTTLVPALRPGDIVVMDNLRCHKVEGVREILLKAKALPLYLPPYSPDFNPIEKLWSKLKALLRKWKVRKSERLKAAIKKAVAAVTSADCNGWFACAGYCQ